jgi:hypothetical protein
MAPWSSAYRLLGYGLLLALAAPACKRRDTVGVDVDAFLARCDSIREPIVAPMSDAGLVEVTTLNMLDTEYHARIKPGTRIEADELRRFCREAMKRKAERRMRVERERNPELYNASADLAGRGDADAP